MDNLDTLKQDYDILSDRLRRYEIILAQTENVLFEWDIRSGQITFSNTWEKLFGFAPISGNAGQALQDGAYFHPDDLPRLVDRMSNLKSGSDYEMAETRILTATGRYLWCRIRASAIRDSAGKLTRVMGIILNIDAEKQAQRALQDRAERDSLTRLLNKNAARKQAEEYLAQFPQGVPCAMLIIDLDDFKQINDRYGHLFGDAVLTKAAREIGRLFRSQDIVARIGGDEFLVLVRGISDWPLLESRCRQLIHGFRNIFSSRGHKVGVSCSVGIALCPEDGTTYYDLFQRADQALYRAKARGKNTFAFYNDQEDRFLPPKTAQSTVSLSIDSEEEPGLADDSIVRYAFRRLYTSSDVEASVGDVLAFIGKKMNVSRVYVFENADDNRSCSNTYEWCNEGIPPEIENLQNISYERDIPNYADNFDEQGIFYCPDIGVLPKPAYDIVTAQGIQSMLQCAIREGGVFRGYVGFDECVEQRLWTKEEIRTLSYFSEMLSVFLLKRREEETVRQQTRELASILENQNALIYIIDPEDCSLQYLNGKTRQLAPDIAPGMRCYRAIMGREERCPGCPSLNIGETKNNSAIMYSEPLRMNMLADATLIQWNRREACLITSRRIPDKGGKP